MTAKDIKALAKARGWQMQEIAELWGIKKTRMSQIIHDQSRKGYYDFAFLGLPDRENKKA